MIAGELHTHRVIKIAVHFIYPIRGLHILIILLLFTEEVLVPKVLVCIILFLKGLFDALATCAVTVKDDGMSVR